MKTVEDICEYIASVVDENPFCVETGCTYVIDTETVMHTTTNNLYASVVRGKLGWLYSIDIDPEHIAAAESLLSVIGGSLYEFLEGDSVRELTLLAHRAKKENWKVSVLCLDSKEFDEWHMVAEYDAIKSALAEKHFVLVDDIHNPNSVKYKKMVPVLKDLGYECVEVKTPTGMLVAAKGYKLP